MILQLLQYVLFTVLAVHSVDAWVSELPGAPARGWNKMFSIPIWNAHEEYDHDIFNSTTVFTITSCAISAFASVYYASFVYLPSLPPSRRTLGPFNTILVIYVFSTLVATLTFIFLGIGKMWATFGVFHNMLEFSILTLFRHRPKSLKEISFLTPCFIHILATIFLTLVIPWPVDAVVFKFQGLVIDYAFVINIGRLYYHNKAIHNKASVGTMVVSSDNDDSNECTSECTSECDDKFVQQLQRQQAKEQKKIEDDPKKHTVAVPVYKNLYILFLAAIVHAIGNTLGTLSYSFVVWIFFQFTYGIAYPMFAYYTIVEPNSSRVSFYKTDYTKEILIYITVSVFSIFSICVGIYTSGKRFLLSDEWN